jgi:hypothetical protein
VLLPSWTITSRFQLVAISALRVALLQRTRHSSQELSILPAKFWAEVTDGACTASEVCCMCTIFQALLKAQGSQLKERPTAKLVLRRLWYLLLDQEVLEKKHVYVYMLSG